MRFAKLRASNDAGFTTPRVPRITTSLKNSAQEPSSLAQKPFGSGTSSGARRRRQWRLPLSNKPTPEQTDYAQQLPRRIALTLVLGVLSLVAWTAPLAMFYPAALTWLFGPPGAEVTPLSGSLIRAWWWIGAWTLAPSLRHLTVLQLVQPGTLLRAVILVPACVVLHKLAGRPLR